MSAVASLTDYRALLARQDWALLRKQLKLFAWKATGSRSMERAEDLAHDAIERLWTDVGVRWDPATEQSLLRFLTGLVRGELSNQRRKKATTHEKATDDETLAELHDDGGSGAPDALLSERETLHHGWTALRQRTQDDAIASSVVDLFARHVTDAAEQAAASGHSIDDIRRARRRVFDHAAAIARERRGGVMATWKKTPDEAWTLMREADLDDLVDEIERMSPAEVDAALDANGGDAAGTARRANGQIEALKEQRARLSWQDEARATLNARRATFAAVRARRPKRTRAELEARVAAAEQDTRLVSFFRKRTTAEQTDEELEALLDEIEMAEELEKEKGEKAPKDKGEP
jgi:hypothetical protein